MNTNTRERIVLTKYDALFIERLIEQNSKYINNIIYNTLGADNQYLAKDTISEFHLLMCEKIGTLKTHPSPKGWILVAAKHTAQGMIAKYKKDSLSVSLDEVSYKLGETDIFEDSIYEIWLENKVPEKLIAHLSKREREVYCKIYIDGKKPKVVAKELNISINAVHNIHKNLRDKIKNDIKRKNFQEIY